MITKKWQRLIDLAIEEDYSTGDVTTESVIDPWISAEAAIVARSKLVTAGMEVCRTVFDKFDPCIDFEPKIGDGDQAEAGTVLAELRGKLAPILAGERIALNFLQRLCGIATMTRQYVEAVEGLDAKIVDTRKTTPGMRELEKHAVKVAGGFNHRFGLFDGILIKDNHIAAFKGDIARAINKARLNAPHTLKIEIETESIEDVKQAMAAGADIIMLDNMSPELMREAVAFINGRAITEASGGVNLETVRTVAETGVDLISIGALTHSAPSSDISLDVKF